MTEKRYSLVYYADKGGAFIRDNKNSIEWYHDSRASLLEIVDKLNELAEESQQLKQSIKEVLKLLEEEVDLFSNKATEHDIQAYIELQELDNKDAYYMAVSTKKAIKILKEMIE